VDGAPAVLDAVRVHAAFIQGETLARQLDIGQRAGRPDAEQEIALDGLTAVVGIQRWDGDRP
jgi:hypothetical protein